jgi:hypothetical protein
VFFAHFYIQMKNKYTVDLFTKCIIFKVASALGNKIDAALALGGKIYQALAQTEGV